MLLEHSTIFISVVNNKTTILIIFNWTYLYKSSSFYDISSCWKFFYRANRWRIHGIHNILASFVNLGYFFPLHSSKRKFYLSQKYKLLEIRIKL